MPVWLRDCPRKAREWIGPGAAAVLGIGVKELRGAFYPGKVGRPHLTELELKGC